MCAYLLLTPPFPPYDQIHLLNVVPLMYKIAIPAPLQMSRVHLYTQHAALCLVIESVAANTFGQSLLNHRLSAINSFFIVFLLSVLLFNRIFKLKSLDLT